VKRDELVEIGIGEDRYQANGHAPWCGFDRLGR
jgi:hypothetical protein